MKFSYAVVALVPLAVFASCNKVPSIVTVPVTGTVTHQGQPVEKATVSFMPVASEKGKPALGVTDAQGRFVAETPLGGGSNMAQGVVAGDYVVTVSKLNIIPRKETMSPDEWKKLSPEEQAKKRSGSAVTTKNKPGEAKDKQGDSAAGPTNALPAKYADVKQSDLRASVKAGAQNDFPFDLLD